MEREVKFSLVFRDMWQSAGKYVPRVDQLVKVAPAIIEMGCFARVETNGGGFEQVNLLFGENPNRAVREWTKPFHEAGIQTHMLDRALNGLRMSPVPADVRKLFYKVKHAQGTDITRTFCGLNDVRNIIPSIGYAHEAGMISQCSLCITFSPIQEFMDDFLGLYISPKNRLMNSLLIAPGLPGGMMGSLMADLETNLESINKYKAKRNLPFMTQDELLIKLFNEVAYVWPRVGYPPLVTPFSQYVKNLAMMNVMAMEKGKERWGMIADDIWDMILGKAGRLPGKLAPEIIEKAEREGRKFFDGNPQDNYPDQLEKYRKMMLEKQWDKGQDDEELFD